MGKRQTRRSVSLRGIVYQRLADYCAAEGVPVSAFVERLVAAELDRLGVPRPAVLRPKARRDKPPPDPSSAGSGHFTF